MRYDLHIKPALILLSTLLVTCTPDFIKNEAPKTNEVEVGSNFTINLPENHNDGYTWQLNDDYERGLIEVKNAVWHGNEKGIYFNFKALSMGELQLNFVKRKHIDTLAVKCFIVKIKDH